MNDRGTAALGWLTLCGVIILAVLLLILASTPQTPDTGHRITALVSHTQVDLKGAQPCAQLQPVAIQLLDHPMQHTPNGETP